MKSFTFALGVLAVLFGCQNTNTGQNTADFEVPSTIPIVTDTFKLDTAYSILTWIGSKPSTQHDGIIRFDSGAIFMQNDLLVGGKLSVSLRSLQIMNVDPAKEDYMKLYNHLMSDDFFDAPNFPNATIEIVGATSWDSTFMEKVNTGFMVTQPTHLFHCLLTIRGTTHKVELPITFQLASGKILSEGKVVIDRTAWGVSYDDEATVVDKIKDKFIHNRVFVGFSLVARHI